MEGEKNKLPPRYLSERISFYRVIELELSSLSQIAISAQQFEENVF